MRIFNKDRRQHFRQVVEAKIRLSHASFGSIDSLSHDISDSGLFVVSELLPRLPKGAHINIQFMDSANPQLLFNTRVVRIFERGIGLVIVDYEFNGQRFSIESLKQQWELASADMYNSDAPTAVYNDELYN